MVKILMQVDDKLIEIGIVKTVEAAKAFIHVLRKNYCIANYFYKAGNTIAKVIQAITNYELKNHGFSLIGIRGFLILIR